MARSKIRDQNLTNKSKNHLIRPSKKKRKKRERGEKGRKTKITGTDMKIKTNNQKRRRKLNLDRKLNQLRNR